MVMAKIPTTCVDCGAKGEVDGPEGIVHKSIRCQPCIKKTPRRKLLWECPCGAQIENVKETIDSHVKICAEFERHTAECFCRGQGGEKHKIKLPTPGHILLHFSCESCKAVYVPFEVPARAAALDVNWWARQIVDPRLTKRHRLRGCRSNLVDLHIPIGNVAGDASPHIGGAY